ncbi:hypothetical protein RRG08_003567 [Elysia crispata]|uniref:PiggyBac transposable element-derived protein domain-containing protein n=1 Tax=Elysia crispata TaxID=231223 RepID=A0AAE1CPN4_9GAST|nr:hypothetical protein RRG08_003567 [Elysia crispata]
MDHDLPQQPGSSSSSGSSESSNGQRRIVKMFNVSEAQVLLDSIPTDYGPVEELFSGCHSPGQYFTTFFDYSIVDDLIFQTTLYITQLERRVSTVTRQDILGFIGINIIMGYHVLPSYTHYWCEDF